MPHVRRSIAILLASLLAGAVGGLGVPSPIGAEEVRADDCYIAANHRIFLDRDAAPADLAEWRTAFADGTPRHALPGALAASDEWLTVVVTRIYDLALERDPEPDGREYWIGQLRSGAMVARIAAQVFGSEEFYDRVDRDDEELVLTLYRLILDRSSGERDSGPGSRTVGQDEIDYWVGQLPTRGRGGVAAAIYGSFESRSRRVNRLYQDILDRRAEPAGRAYWAERLTTMNDVRLAVFLAASIELRDRTARGCTLAGEIAFTDLTPTAGWVEEPDTSADGRYVVFAAFGSELVIEPDDFTRNIFLLDTATGIATNLTIGGDGNSAEPSISADGTQVVFTSRATNLTADDGDNVADVFLHDVASGETTNLTATTSQAATRPQISADGSTVAYLAGPPSGTRTVILHDLSDGSTTDITAATTADAGELSLAGDGTRIAFATYANELTPDPDDDVSDVFVHDTTTGETINVTAAGDGDSAFPHLSADGRRLAFRSQAGTLDGPTAGRAHLFVADLDTGTIVNLTPGANRGVGEDLSLSADGGVVAFSSRATNLTGDPDNNDAEDIFVTETVPGSPIVNVTAATYLAEEPEDDGSTQPVLAADASSLVFVTGDPVLVDHADRRSLIRAEGA